MNGSTLGRKLLKTALGVAQDAPLPRYHTKSARGRLADKVGRREVTAEPAGRTKGRVVLFSTCYGNHNMPGVVEDLDVIFEHNGIATALASRERCCGMPKLELGDLKAVEQYKNENIDELYGWVQDGLVFERWLCPLSTPACDK